MGNLGACHRLGELSIDLGLLGQAPCSRMVFPSESVLGARKLILRKGEGARSILSGVRLARSANRNLGSGKLRARW